VTAHVESGALLQNRFAASFTSRFSNLLELVRRNLPGDQAAVRLQKTRFPGMMKNRCKVNMVAARGDSYLRRFEQGNSVLSSCHLTAKINEIP